MFWTPMILNNKLHMVSIQNSIQSLQILFYISHPVLLKRVFDNNKINSTFFNYIFYRFTINDCKKNILFDFECDDAIDIAIHQLIDSVKTIIDEDLTIWQKSINNWDLLINNIIEQFGENWSLQLMAVIAGAVKSNKETFLDFDNLHNNKLSLCKRVRCARMKSGNINYWLRQLKESNDILFTLLVFYTWATPKTICSLFEICETIITTLSKEDYIKLDYGLKAVSDISSYSTMQVRYIKEKLKNLTLSDELLNILSIRFDEHNRNDFLYNNIKSPNDKIVDLEGNKYFYLMKKFHTEDFNIKYLKEIKELYKNKDSKYYSLRRGVYGNYRRQKGFSIEIANEIMENACLYPREIVFRAEFSCRLDASKKVVPVGKVAENEGWF